MNTRPAPSSLRPRPSRRRTVPVPAKWSRHHRALLALRRRLLRAQLSELEETLRPAETVPGEPAGDPDGRRDFTLALLAREQDALGEIDAALHRIEAGSYGVCEATGLPIPAARLRTMPWTRHVREMAQQREELRRPRR